MEPGIAGLFSQAVNVCQQFSVSYKPCQLQLDNERRRLVNWGIAVDIYGNPQFDRREEAAVRDTIQAIIGQFQNAQGVSSRYGENINRADQKAMVIFGLKKGHRKLPEPYDGKKLETLVTSMHDNVSTLVQLASASPRLETRMAKLTPTELDELDCGHDVSDIKLGESANFRVGDDISISALQALAKFGKLKIMHSHRVKGVELEANSTFRVGNNYGA
ncbi:hypothetical protein B0I37DRAFT_378184 [Chaetomium sp. MPI-CAGE-AT-0009]|nr:hypothetical protein B0I37DRAFT_378184 [Chaetomium sp. MPI-CAGE-AT-0009]